MNGIIHNCSHGDDGSAFPPTEDEMMLKVFLYLDKLIGLVRPKRLLFLALDGAWSEQHHRSLLS
jgi:5'-3' exonuclease